MKSFVETNGGTMKWSGRWEYALRAGDDIIGTLHVTDRTGASAVAESSDGRWHFEKKWFPADKVTLRLPGADTELAIFKNKVIENRSALEFRDGHMFYWFPSNFWRNKYIFTDSFGERLIYFTRFSNPFAALAMPKGECRGRVKIEYRALWIPEIALLALLGCYLMVLESM